MKKQEKPIAGKGRMIEEEIVKSLLEKRTRQIKRLHDELAGWEETARLSGAFLLLLTLALIKDKEATEAVCAQPLADGTPSLLILRDGITALLDKCRVKIEKEESAYRIIFGEDGRGA